MPHAASPVEITNWQRVRWPDGSRYEGLVKGNLCHIRGVTVFPDGDRYEGEFVDNHMQGAGVYSWRDGTVYQGEWTGDQMHGCGIKKSMQESGELEVESGQFKDDKFLGLSTCCDAAAAQQASQRAQDAARQARGLLQVVPTQQPKQADELVPVLSHDEAFSMQYRSKPNLKGGQQHAAILTATAEPPAEAASVTKPRLPLRQFWLPWSLWHS